MCLGWKHIAHELKFQFPPTPPPPSLSLTPTHHMCIVSYSSNVSHLSGVYKSLCACGADGANAGEV